MTGCIAWTRIKIPIPLQGSRPPANAWFCGPTRVHCPNVMSIGSAFLESFRLCATDKHRDRWIHRTQNIGKNRPHSCTLLHAVQPDTLLSS